MRKKVVILILITVTVFVFIFGILAFVNNSVEIKEDTVFNYLTSTSMFSAGNKFITLGDESKTINLIQANENGTQIYKVQENAVDEIQNEHSRIYSLIATDDNSFYYSINSFSNAYGVSNGTRIYRYDIKAGKTEVIYRDVSLTNFDAFLGLDEILNFFAPTGNNSGGLSGYCINGKEILTQSVLVELLLDKIKEQGLDLNIDNRAIRYCISNRNVFFTDAENNLWVYNSKTKGISQLPFYNISAFFVTKNNLFVIPSLGDNISVCDLNGNFVKEIEIFGAEFPALNSLQIENDRVYFKDGNNIVWVIDENLKVVDASLIEPEAEWTVKEGVVYTWNNGELKPLTNI